MRDNGVVPAVAADGPVPVALSASSTVLIVTDAWAPQVNGVVRTMAQTRDHLEHLGYRVVMLTPDRFRTLPLPTYREIRLSLASTSQVARALDEAAPDAIHLATEGPLGWAARRVCLKRGLPFTTSFHTRFPEYIQVRLGVPLSWTYPIFRRFHAPAARVMAATHSLKTELESQGFHDVVLWSRGVDLDTFQPGARDFLGTERPIFLSVGRVAVEKNVEAFLALDLPGSKWVVGDGPQLDELKRRFPDTHFPGMKTHAELAPYYAAADVFVFPSRTDTFGLVILEALACGLPVAAYPVTGPKDVVDDSGVGVLDEDLGQACLRALSISRTACRAYAQGFSWEACARQFLAHLAPIAR